MKKIFFISLLFLLRITAWGRDKVIYGADNRIFAENVDNSRVALWAQSVAAMVHKSLFKRMDGGKLWSSYPLGYVHPELCQDEPFLDAMVGSLCSGFLVADDMLMTAGHCIKTQDECDEYYWSFSFENHRIKDNSLFVEENELYSCQKIIKTVVDNDNKTDFALIKLDRKVEGRGPLELRDRGMIDSKENLIVIGHPNGLPKITSLSVQVINNNHSHYFVTDADTFFGSSGSPVINFQSGQVEGVLVRGEEDFFYDRNNRCERSMVCLEGECRGEDVTRSTVFSHLVL